MWTLPRHLGTISLSSFSGGSFLSSVLTEKNNEGQTKHLGAWSDNATYNENSTIDLILNNNSQGCAPCVLLKTNQRVDTLKTNFLPDASFINNSKISLSEKKSFIFKHDVAQKYTLTKIVSFSPNSYTSSHKVSIINHDGVGRSVGLVWDKGIRNTEKNENYKAYLPYTYSNLEFLKIFWNQLTFDKND